MIRGKCVSSAGGFVSTEWPNLFAQPPKIGDLVYKLPTITGALNTTTAPLVVESSTRMTISAVAHKEGVFLNGSGCYSLQPYIEVTIS
jgi:hypothetical protein